MITLESATRSIDLSTGSADGDGNVWRASALDGWEAPPTRTESEARTGADGIVVASNEIDGWPLVLHGSCTSVSAAESRDARNYLTALLVEIIPVDDAGTISETIGAATESLDVLYSGRLKVDRRTPTFFFFQVPLLSTDTAKTVT